MGAGVKIKKRSKPSHDLLRVLHYCIKKCVEERITKHLKNIFESGELERQATCSILELVQKEGNRMVRRNVEIYNLDVIISVLMRQSITSAPASRT